MTLGEMAVQVQALLDAGVPASARVSDFAAQEAA